MSYSLVIADDERIIRKSLSEIVKWDEFGFDLKAVFDDGAQVLEYLKDHPVDCLIIDIQMIKVSGLEVAKFIHDNSLPTKVILLTGHKNFEFARQAVEFQVAHYLLKPVILPEIERVLILIRKRLDESAARERVIEERQDSYNRLINYEKEQFIAGIAHGALTDHVQLVKRLNLIGGNEIDLSQACIMFAIILKEDDNLLDLLNTYGLQELREYLTKVLRTFDESLDFYPLESFGYQMNGIMLEKYSGRLAPYGADAPKFERAVSGLLRMALGLEAQVRLVNYFSRLLDMTGYQHTPELFTNELDENLKSQLRQQKKLLMTYIIGLEPELALPLFASFVGQCHVIGLTGVKNQIIHFFSTLMDRMQNEFPELQNAIISKVSFVKISQMKNEDVLIEWGQQVISWLVEQLAKMGHQAKDKNIQKISCFIEENYNRDITLSDVAEHVYLNPVYISKIFKDKTGKTFTEYLTDLRMEAAAKLLKQPGIYVYEVCEQVGYHNIRHFYKVFKKKMGYSPTEYREMIVREKHKK